MYRSIFSHVIQQASTKKKKLNKKEKGAVVSGFGKKESNQRKNEYQDLVGISCRHTTKKKINKEKGAIVFGFQVAQEM